MTSCEPALAQESAHSRLMGLSRFFVKAHAESRTLPSTETLFCCAERSKHDTPTIAMNVNTRVKRFGVIAIGWISLPRTRQSAVVRGHANTSPESGHQGVAIENTQGIAPSAQCRATMVKEVLNRGVRRLNSRLLNGRIATALQQINKQKEKSEVVGSIRGNSDP